MKKILSIVLVITSLSCEQISTLLNNKVYFRIHNLSGKNLVLSAKGTISTYMNETYKIAKRDSIEIESVRQNITLLRYDSVYVNFEDGKKLQFQRYEYSDKNFLDPHFEFSETPKKGKYKNILIKHYYITPSHYELAE